VADFETKLRLLSERGNPVGAEELIERIEAELAGDPLVVVNKRREGTPMTRTQQRQRPRRQSRNRGPVWGAAVFAAILAVAATYFAFAADSGEVAGDPPSPTTLAPDVETLTDLQVIQAGVEALYSGAAERAVELFGIDDGDDEAQKRFDELIRQEAAFQAIVAGRLALDCTEVGPGMFTCNVPYHNALTDEMGYVDSPGDLIQVVVQDGVITQFGYPNHLVQGITHEFPWHNYAMVPFLREEVDGSDGCWDHSNPSNWMIIRTPECARLIMDHLDEWAAWYRTNG
jgi:hypothetical protein